MIEPALPRFTKFAAKGDSGALVVDAEQHAVGLIFAGMSELPKSQGASLDTESAEKPKRIESYGVANPISEVLHRLKIELLV